MNFRIQSFLIAIVLCLAVWACAPSAEEKRKMVPSNYETTEADSIISSSAAIENKADTVHKFIRTAELKFKVKKVTEATYFIEDITRKMDGFVTYTNLSSHVTNNATTRISDDSLVNLTNFQVQNDMTIRVPNSKLDTTLKLIAKTISFLDYRIIKADDVNSNENIEVTHINLNDNTIEGIRLKGKKAFSVQYHPEAAPGPHDSRYLFDDFVKLMN
jgi:CTP synthase (UTP-ammonia lyase)